MRRSRSPGCALGWLILTCLGKTQLGRPVLDRPCPLTVLPSSASLVPVVLRIGFYAAAAHHVIAGLAICSGDSKHVRLLNSDLEGPSSIGWTLAARVRLSDSFEVAVDVYDVVASWGWHTNR